MNLTENTDKLLPFGYIFLVILGIIKESVYYNQMGINILRHSNIMDVLLSPIADIASHPIVLFSFLGFILVLYLSILFLSRNYKKPWVMKFFGSKKPSEELKEEDVKRQFGNLLITTFVMGMFSFFLGIGVGTGKKVADNIANDNLNYKYSITFISNETKEVFLIGSNSANYFYVEKGSKNVKISPTSSIKVVEFIKSEATK